MDNRAGNGARRFDLRIEELSNAELKPRARNARTHSKKQISKIAAGIKQFGFVNPVLIDANNGIVAGHGRVEASKKLGLDKVQMVRLEHLSEIKLKAYVLADNQLATQAGWDKEILRIDLQDLISVNGEIDVTISFANLRVGKYIGSPEGGRLEEDSDLMNRRRLDRAGALGITQSQFGPRRADGGASARRTSHCHFAVGRMLWNKTDCIGCSTQDRVEAR